MKTNASIELTDIDVSAEIESFPLVPYPTRIYVIEERVEKVGSLYIPETVRKDGEMKTNVGVVVACGADIGFVVPGDRIIYATFSGSWVMNEKYRVMNEKDLLGRFKENSPINGAES